MTLQAGQVIEGKYRIIKLLGEGGMGAVYEGENTRIHRRVAIKVLHAGVAAKEDVVQRFEREAQAAGRIGSEHIVEVLDLGSLASGERFMVMEYLDGEALGDRIKSRGRMTPQELGPIAYQLLEGLAAAHDAGIVHRDLKPDNVYLLRSKSGQRDFVKILDFGVSKFNALDQEMSMTRTGAVMGTPYYMSPEQARGQKVDPRSDLYSVGVVCYQAVTGRVPFNAETFNELVFKIALESPEPAEVVVPELDRSFAALISRAMVRDVSGRFQSARELQGAIGQWMQANAGGQANMSGPYAAMSQGAAMARSGSMPDHFPAPDQFPGRGHPSGPGQGHPSSPGQGHPSNPGLSHSGQVYPGQGQQGHAGQQGGQHPGQSYPGPGQPSFGHAIGNEMSSSGSGLSNSGPFGVSHAALAITNKQPKRGGALVALGLAAVLMGVGGGFVLYKYATASASEATPAAGGEEVEQPSELVEADLTKPVEGEPAEPVDPPIEEGDPAGADPAETAAPDAPPTPPGQASPGHGQAPPVQAPPNKPPPFKPPNGQPPAKPPEPPPPAPPPAKDPGRSVSGEL